MDSSDIAIAEYVIDPDTVSIPNFNPSSGTYNLPQSVEITCDTDGATIYYTTDNSNPTASSTEYSTAIRINTTTTIKAFAVKAGMDDSDSATGTFNIDFDDVSTPAFGPVQGTYNSEIDVSKLT